MSLLQDREAITPEQYLEDELHCEVRHEYLAGKVYAMSGSSVEHNRIAGNIFAALLASLDGKPCEPFITDMKAHITLPSGDWYYYPDVMVNCDPTGQKQYYCDTPSVIFEVQSPSTERTDEREKFLVYQAIPQLQTYVLVRQDRREVRAHRREVHWKPEFLSGGDVLPLPEIQCSLSLDVIYRRTGL